MTSRHLDDAIAASAIQSLQATRFQVHICCHNILTNSVKACRSSAMPSPSKCLAHTKSCCCNIWHDHELSNHPKQSHFYTSDSCGLKARSVTTDNTSSAFKQVQVAGDASGMPTRRGPFSKQLFADTNRSNHLSSLSIST